VRKPKQEEIDDWLNKAAPFGIAVVGGLVSGGQNGVGLEILDFDSADLYQPWAEKVEQQIPGLVDRLVRVQSPRPGVHVYYRCSAFGGSQKLASVADNKAGKVERKTLIELKGEGGYCIVPPSPKACHPSNKRYTLLKGSPDLTSISLVREADREVMLAVARSFNRWVEPTRPVPAKKVVIERGSATRPGDVLNEKVEWREILESHGWKRAGVRGHIEDWQRPGKDGSGISATVNYADRGLLYVFSSNAFPFEPGRSYSKFQAYTLLNHGGDYRAAARELRSRGYGLA
jgi:putative DNA primase/helicase